MNITLRKKMVRSKIPAGNDLPPWTAAGQFFFRTTTTMIPIIASTISRIISIKILSLESRLKNVKLDWISDQT